jgi:hypothetical protein
LRAFSLPHSPFALKGTNNGLHYELPRPGAYPRTAQRHPVGCDQTDAGDVELDRLLNPVLCRHILKTAAGGASCYCAAT